MIGTGKGRSAGGPPQAACRSSGPPTARCDRPPSSLDLEEDSADSEVDWEAVSSLDGHSYSRAEEDSCGYSSASHSRDSRGAAPEGAPQPEGLSRAVSNLLHFADRLLDSFYLCAVRRFAFYATGVLLAETKEKERLRGLTARNCPQIARRKRHGRAWAQWKRNLPGKKAFPRFRWGYLVKYARRLGLKNTYDAGATEEHDSAAEV